jgi:tetrahydromethanopterin S-methyltransferase subunit B
MKDLVSSWVMGGFVGVLGLVGLVMASGARDDAIYGFGLGVFVFAVLFVFLLIKRGFDAAGRPGG